MVKCTRAKLSVAVGALTDNKNESKVKSKVNSVEMLTFSFKNSNTTENDILSIECEHQAVHWIHLN